MAVAVEDSKNKLRKYAKLKRKNIKNKEILEEKIKINVLNNQYIFNTKNILIYMSLEDEVDTKLIIEDLWKLNKNIYVPKVEDNNISFYKINNFNDLQKGVFNILEPKTNIKYKDENACIIVPGLLFDKNNNRLGYGGGYYDRFLQNRNIYKIGICFSTMIVDKIITEKTEK